MAMLMTGITAPMLTDSAQEAVDNDLMKESDARSPIMSPRRTSSVTFGGGKRK